jgi:hypothetical protein
MTTKKPIARQSAERAVNKTKKVGLARALSKLGFCPQIASYCVFRFRRRFRFASILASASSRCFSVMSFGW